MPYVARTRSRRPATCSQQPARPVPRRHVGRTFHQSDRFPVLDLSQAVAKLEDHRGSPRAPQYAIPAFDPLHCLVSRRPCLSPFPEPATSITCSAAGDLYASYTQLSGGGEPGLSPGAVRLQEHDSRLTRHEHEQSKPLPTAPPRSPRRSAFSLGVAQDEPRTDHQCRPQSPPPPNTTRSCTPVCATRRRRESSTTRTAAAPLVRLCKLVDGETARASWSEPRDFFARWRRLTPSPRGVRGAEALLIVVTDPIALGLMGAHSACGADIIVADEVRHSSIPPSTIDDGDVSASPPHARVVQSDRCQRTSSYGETVDAEDQPRLCSPAL